MADHLLSILRGTAPAPAAPPRSPHHQSTPSPSLSRHDSASQGQPTSSASNGSNAEERDSTAQRNPLEQLLRTFSQPRPSPSPSSLPTQGEADTEQAPTTTTTSKDSATLLSLLKGSSSPAPVPTSPPITSPLLSPRGGNAKDLLGLLMGGSAPPSPAAAAAPSSSASGPLASTDPAATSPEETTEANEAQETGQTLGLTGMQEEAVAPAEAKNTASSSTTSAAPVFTFVSPFDFLDSIRSPPPPPATTANQTEDGQQQQQQQRDAAVPQSLPTPVPTPTESVASPEPGPGRGDAGRRSFAASAPVAFVSAAASIPSAPSPTSILSASEVGAQSNATTPPNGGGGGAGAGSKFPHEYLASAYIPPAPAPAPSWAPLGVRLPRRASLPPNAPQHLTISASDPHHEALVPSPPEVTPIALFSVPADDRRSLARTRTAGIWERGIAYASAAGSGKHRIRVIDRESGAKVLLKGKRDEKEVVDLQVDRSSQDGQRRIACVANGGALSVWQVPDHFEDEAEALKQCVCTCPPLEN